MCSAPVVLYLLSSSPDKEVIQHPVHIMTSGAPPPAPVLLRIESLGFVVSHGYGLTEAAGFVVTCAWKNAWNKLPMPATERARLKARQGVRTIGCMEVDVVDFKTKERVKGDGFSLGEVVLRGGCVMIGYLKDPEVTSKGMREDGWLHTGDVAVMHPHGYLSGGENISSAEVESVLYMNPAINEAAVVARLDDFWGETPRAFVSLRNDITHKPNEMSIIEFCRERLAHFMAPKKVIFIEDLPKTFN